MVFFCFAGGIVCCGNMVMLVVSFSFVLVGVIFVYGRAVMKVAYLF